MSCQAPPTVTTPTSVPSATSDHFGAPEGAVSRGNALTHQTWIGTSPTGTVIASGERSVAMAGAMSEGGGAAALVAVSAWPEGDVPAARTATRIATRVNSCPRAQTTRTC